MAKNKGTRRNRTRERIKECQKQREQEEIKREEKLKQSHWITEKMDYLMTQVRKQLQWLRLQMLPWKESAMWLTGFVTLNYLLLSALLCVIPQLLVVGVLLFLQWYYYVDILKKSMGCVKEMHNNTNNININNRPNLNNNKEQIWRQALIILLEIIILNLKQKDTTVAVSLVDEKPGVDVR